MSLFLQVNSLPLTHQVNLYLLGTYSVPGPDEEQDVAPDLTEVWHVGDAGEETGSPWSVPGWRWGWVPQGLWRTS